MLQHADAGSGAGIRTVSAWQANGYRQLCLVSFNFVPSQAHFCSLPSLAVKMCWCVCVFVRFVGWTSAAANIQSFTLWPMCESALTSDRLAAMFYVSTGTTLCTTTDVTLIWFYARCNIVGRAMAANIRCSWKIPIRKLLISEIIVNILLLPLSPPITLCDAMCCRGWLSPSPSPRPTPMMGRRTAQTDGRKTQCAWGCTYACRIHHAMTNSNERRWCVTAWLRIHVHIS